MSNQDAILGVDIDSTPNNEVKKERDVKICISQTLHKSITISTASDDLREAFFEGYYDIETLLTKFQDIIKELNYGGYSLSIKNKLNFLYEDCKGWHVDETEFIND